MTAGLVELGLLLILVSSVTLNILTEMIKRTISYVTSDNIVNHRMTNLYLQECSYAQNLLTG